MFYILLTGLGLRFKAGFDFPLTVVIGKVAVLTHAFRVVLFGLVFAFPGVLFSFPLVVAADAHLSRKNPPNKCVRAPFILLSQFNFTRTRTGSLVWFAFLFRVLIGNALKLCVFLVDRTFDSGGQRLKLHYLVAGRRLFLKRRQVSFPLR